MEVAGSQVTLTPHICDSHCRCDCKQTLQLPEPKPEPESVMSEDSQSPGQSLRTSTRGLCYCKEPPHRNPHPHRTPPPLTLPVLVIHTIIMFASFGLCLYTAFTGQVRNGFSLANDGFGFIQSNGSTNSSSSTGTNQTLHAGDDWLGGIDFAPDTEHDLLIYAYAFRLLPTIVAGLISIGFMSAIDLNHRFVQPFLAMHESPGTASQTVLQEYTTASSLSIPQHAFANGHYKVAFYSVLSTIGPIFPIFVGGLFTMTNTGKRVYFSYDLPAFIIVTAFVVLYCISLPMAWPTRKRRMPRVRYSMIDIVAMCHASHFIRSPNFDISSKRATREYMCSRIFLREDNCEDKYQYGEYFGVDGKWHLGFDVAEIEGESTGMVHHIPVEAPRKPRAEAQRRRNNSARHQRLQSEDLEMNMMHGALQSEEFRADNLHNA